MILDARDERVALTRSADIAIVGAGPAGLTLARELAEVASVLVIESGGMEHDDQLQSLYEGESIGIRYPLTETRLRRFGGSSGIWAGYCAMFDPADFALRPWIPDSGWPLEFDEVRRYHAKAANLLNLRDDQFDARDIGRCAGITSPFDRERFVASVWRFGSPTIRFGEHLREEFETASGVTTLTHANLVDIRLDSGLGGVKELIIRTISGREGRVRAGIHVLACGGIETARLLLNSNSQVAQGVGNSHDLVGRYFMEHPHLPVPCLAVDETRLPRSWVDREFLDDGEAFLSAVGLNARMQEDAQVLNARAHVYRTPQMSLDEAPRLGLFMEQAPNRESRVSLSDARDGLGMRRVRLDWQLRDLDWHSYRSTANALTLEFTRLGIGTVDEPGTLQRLDSGSVLHSNHHLGTTRMSASPAEGVVNPDCRVHDLENLYIAGGSVFPTVSWANPTLTLLALVHRLADHLRTVLAAGTNRTFRNRAKPSVSAL